MLPSPSTTVRWLVEVPSVPVGSAAVELAQAVLYGGDGLPGATGLAAAVGPIRQRRWLANPFDSRPSSGTSKYEGSPTQRLRSANASRVDSRERWSASARSGAGMLKPSRMFSASPMVEPPLDGGGMP